MANVALSVRPALAAVLLAVSASEAWAQAPRPPAFRPDVSAGLVFDDNVLRRPVATSDLILRVTPGLDIRYESTRLTFGTYYRFDAERYEEQTTLTTALARQSTGFNLTVGPIRRTAFTLRAGYEQTETPQDLNLTTGLTAGRQRASRRNVSGDLQFTIRPDRTAGLGFAYSNDDMAGTGSEGHVAQARFSQRLDSRNDVNVAYRLERRWFDPGDHFITHLALIGWSHRVTRALVFTVQGGARETAGEVRPDVAVSLVRTIGGLASVSASYAHTQTVALGVTGLVPVDSVSSAVTVRRTSRWEVVVGGGAFRNVVLGSTVVAYDLSGSIGRALGRSTWLVGSAAASLNDSSVSGSAVTSSQFRRNVIALSLRVSPWRPQ